MCFKAQIHRALSCLNFMSPYAPCGLQTARKARDRTSQIGDDARKRVKQSVTSLSLSGAIVSFTFVLIFPCTLFPVPHARCVHLSTSFSVPFSNPAYRALSFLPNVKIFCVINAQVSTASFPYVYFTSFYLSSSSSSPQSMQQNRVQSRSSTIIPSHRLLSLCYLRNRSQFCNPCS